MRTSIARHRLAGLLLAAVITLPVSHVTISFAQDPHGPGGFQPQAYLSPAYR